jgi:hypothetical protein
MRKLLYVAALLGGSLLPLAQPVAVAAPVVTRPHHNYYRHHYYRHPSHRYYYRGRWYYR